jgi:hypothetical protein
MKMKNHNNPSKEQMTFILILPFFKKHNVMIISNLLERELINMFGARMMKDLSGIRFVSIIR